MADSQQDDKQTDPKAEEQKIEQVKTANEMEKAKWEGDFPEEDLKVSYKREEKEDEKEPDEPKPGDAVATDDDKDEQPVPEPPEPVVTMEDPGEYKPADYSFEVTLKDGKTVKISTPNEAEKIADDPENFETPKQLMDFLNKQNKMNRNLERDFEKWEASKQTFTQQVETEQERRQNVENLTSEMDYMVSKGFVPAVDDKYKTMDWTDPEVAKQPGIKEQVELLNYMVKENSARAKAGVKPLGSLLDTYNAMQLDSDRKKAQEDKKLAGEQRKVAGAKVAGVSPSQQGTFVPKGIAVGNPNVFKHSETQWDN